MNDVRKAWTRLAGIGQVLGTDESRPAHRLRRPAIWAAAVVLAVFGVIGYSLLRKGPELRFVTENARRGDLVVTVTAAGTVRPTNQVDIRSELPGTVSTVEVDFNDEVHAGQVLAKLDTSRLESQVLQSRAAVESATAGVQEAEAAASDAEGELARLRQVRKLSGGEVPSKQEYASARTALSRAQAAAVSARAALAEAKATLDAQQTDLDEAVIRSPINGMVLTRAVEPGQAVAPSPQVPAMFTLAKDLSRMRLVVDVDEADVGQVQSGQDANFTVDAWPNKKFQAKVMQVRYGAKTIQGVVTYEVVLSFDNSARLLRPGMTATAAIVVDKVSNAIIVPNAALRYEPPAPKDKHPGGLLESLLSKHREAPPPEVSVQAPGSQARVWVLRDRRPAAVEVKVGRSDGSWTEVEGIDAGTSVIVDSIEKPA
jgi:HlyD family secretion protein